MASNDAIVLKANFADWKSRADGLECDPWLYYCLEQFLKSYAIDDDDLESGITDGGNDGGIDGHYFLVNNRQVINADTHVEPKTASNVRLLFFQIKTSGGMKPTEIEKWLETADDFFNLSAKPEDFGDRYSKRIQAAMRVWRDQYLKMSVHFPEVAIDFYYITGDDAAPDTYALDSCKRVKDRVEKALKSTCTVNCIGAKELWEQVQKRPPRSRPLKWAEQPMSTKDGYVGLVKLPDFRAFLADESGALAERIFESNVRGFVLDSDVNDDIAKSLRDPTDEPNFWLLNNGVTMIAAKTSPAHLMLTVDDPQIVNGLQTSRVIFDTLSNDSTDDRTVLVRIIETTDQKTQDRIIKATNSQNKMQAASLRMTDQIHRDIEQAFKDDGLFYDRRRGFYKDQGRPIKKIISSTAVAQAVVSIMLQRPDDARARPGDYFKDENRYRSVFASPKIPVQTYLACVKIIRHVEAYLAKRNIERSDIKNLAFYVAASSARKIAGTKHVSAGKLLNPSQILDSTLASALNDVQTFYRKLSQSADSDSVARGTVLLQRINSQWDRRRRGAKKKG